MPTDLYSGSSEWMYKKGNWGSCWSVLNLKRKRKWFQTWKTSDYTTQEESVQQHDFDHNSDESLRRSWLYVDGRESGSRTTKKGESVPTIHPRHSILISSLSFLRKHFIFYELTIQGIYVAERHRNIKLSLPVFQYIGHRLLGKYFSPVVLFFFSSFLLHWIVFFILKDS